MYRKISSKTCQLLIAAKLTLIVSIIGIAQTPERAVEGQPQTNHKISATGHRISGTVTMEPSGYPVVRAGIKIESLNRSKPNSKPFMNQTFTDEQGRWTVDVVPDGDYLILIEPITAPPVNNKNGQMNEANSRAGTIFVVQAREVKLSGTNIDNLEIRVIKGGRITGKVIMEDGDPLPKDLIVLPEQTAKDGRSPVRFAPVQPDGSFILESVPTGSIFLRAVVYGKPNEFFIKAATLDGTNILRESLNIEDGSEVKNIQIVFAKATKK